MGHRHDWMEQVRYLVLVKLGVLAQFIHDVTGLPAYTRSETHVNRFVGRVRMNEEDFEVALHEMGFQRNPLAALKNRASGEIEEGSWRKILVDEPEKQLHVVLYDGEQIQSADNDYIYVYAHKEYRWDVHPWAHYMGREVNGPEGVRLTKKILHDNSIDYEPIRP